MLRCHLIFKLFFLLFFTFPLLAEQFLEGTEDVPLMAGMVYSQEETFSIDNEDGRLYFSKTLTSENVEKIWRFYEETLPQMGWNEIEKGLFTRDGDTLRIGVYENLPKNGVFFELITKSK